MKRVINLHLQEGEHAWLSSYAKREGTTMTAVLRDQIRDHMRRELAAAGIAAGLRCAWQDCLDPPANDGSDRPTLCARHQAEAEAQFKERRRSARRDRR